MQDAASSPEAGGVVKVYGAAWCGVTRRALSHLDQVGVAYDFIDVDNDPAASEWVKERNGGVELKPTLDVAGDVVTANQLDTLDDTLRAHGFLV